MKKKIYLLMTAMMLTMVALTSNAAVIDNKGYSKEDFATMTIAERNARVEEIKLRVNEIKAMDKSSLSKEERKELKSELKSLKKEANAASTGGGVYLSVGAIIIIILVLILIL